MNRYSISLPRYAFIHRDYMNWYMTDLPKSIFQRIHDNFNCEDIAMSFFISTYTNGRPPLLADFWAMESMVKLYSEKRISGNKGHKSFRDSCVNDFATILGLKDKLQSAPVIYRNHTMFHAGDRYDENKNLQQQHQTSMTKKGTRQASFIKKIQQWHKLSNKEMMKKIAKMKDDISVEAMKVGLIEKTIPWKKRFNIKR